jgi:integrase
VAERLAPMFGPMVVFAAATGLRPSELFALEQGDVDRAAGVVQIRRAACERRVKPTKTRLSRRAVPLQAIALPRLTTTDELRRCFCQVSREWSARSRTSSPRASWRRAAPSRTSSPAPDLTRARRAEDTNHDRTKVVADA